MPSQRPEKSKPVAGQAQPKAPAAPARAPAPHVAAAMGLAAQKKALGAAMPAPAAHVAAALAGGRRLQPKTATSAVVQRAEAPKRYVPPQKRAGAAPAAAAAAAVPLHREQGRPLYNWLNGAGALSLSRVVNQAGDYVTLELVEQAHIGGAGRLIQFNVHDYFGAHPTLGSVWANGVYHCELNAQENPRRATMLQLWTNYIARGNNPSLSYDEEDHTWDVYFDAD